jgi:hypothetical protein
LSGLASYDVGEQVTGGGEELIVGRLVCDHPTGTAPNPFEDCAIVTALRGLGGIAGLAADESPA